MSAINIPQIIQNLLYQTQPRLEEFKTKSQFIGYTDALILNTLQANPQFMACKDDLIDQWRRTIQEQLAFWDKELLIAKQELLIRVSQGYLHAVGLIAPEERNIQNLQTAIIDHLKQHSLIALLKHQQEQQQDNNNTQQQQQQLIMIPLETLETAAKLSYDMSINECYTCLAIPTFMKQSKASVEAEVRGASQPILDAIRQSELEIIDYIRRNVLYAFLSPEFLGAQYEGPAGVLQFPSDLTAIISLLNYGNTKYGVSCYAVETIMFKKLFAAFDVYNALMQLHGFPGDPQWPQAARSLPPELGQIAVDLVTLAYGLRKTICPPNKYLDIQMEASNPSNPANNPTNNPNSNPTNASNLPFDFALVKPTLDAAVGGANVLQSYVRYSACPGRVWVSAISNGVDIPKLAEALAGMVPQGGPLGGLGADINGVRLSAVDVLSPHFAAIGLPPSLAQNPDETAGNLLYYITAACHEAPLSYFCCPRADQGADIVFCMPSLRAQRRLLAVQVSMGPGATLPFAPCPTYAITATEAARATFPGAVLWFLLAFCAGQPIVAVDLANMGTVRVTLLPQTQQGQPHFVEAGRVALHKYGVVATLEVEDETGFDPMARPQPISDAIIEAVAVGTSRITKVEDGFSALDGFAWDPSRWSRLWDRVQRLDAKRRCAANVLVATTTYLYMMSPKRYIDQICPLGSSAKTWERIHRPDVLVGASECIHFMDGGYSTTTTTNTTNNNNNNDNNNTSKNNSGDGAKNGENSQNGSTLSSGANGNLDEKGNGKRDSFCFTKPRYERTVVSVVNQESLDTARQLKAEDPKKRVAVLNMANPTHPGGSWMGGYMAQEESLFLRSSLMLALDPLEYPLDEYDCYYSRDVTVFRDNAKSGYAFLAPEAQWKLDVASVCAVNMARETEQFGPKHRVRTGLKLFALFNALVRNGIDTVVLGAFGCGILRNPPSEVAEIFKDLITFYAGHFDKIYFAIMDSNSEKITPFINILLEPATKAELSAGSRSVSSIAAPNVLTRSYPALHHPLPAPVDLRQTPKICANGGFCTNVAEEHFAEFAHPPPCPAGPACTITTPWHRAIFWHTKPCPRGMGCKLAGVPGIAPEALERHARFFSHPPPCPAGGLCEDASDAHVTAFMHPPFCDEFLMFGSCSKVADPEHSKALRHYQPTPLIQQAYAAASTQQTLESNAANPSLLPPGSAQDTTTAAATTATIAAPAGSPAPAGGMGYGGSQSALQPPASSPMGGGFSGMGTVVSSSSSSSSCRSNGGVGGVCGVGSLPFCSIVECPIFANENHPEHNSHCAECVHVCPYGQDCGLMNDPAHMALCKHMSKPVCNYWCNCTLMDDPDHRFKFHHKGEWDYLVPCPDGPACLNKGNFTHARRYYHNGCGVSHDPKTLLFSDN